MLLDLTTFTEIDPLNHWSQTSSRNTGANIIRDESSYVYKDYGVDFFGDTVQDIDVEITSVTNQSYYYPPVIGVWGLFNNLGDYASASNPSLSVYTEMIRNSTTNYYIRFRCAQNYQSQSYYATIGTKYYLKITSNGTNGTCKIYPTSGDRVADTNILQTLSITVVATLYRYLKVGFSWGQNSSGITATGYVENVDDGTLPPEIIETDTLSLSDSIAVLRSGEETLEKPDACTLNDAIEIYGIDIVDINNKIYISKEELIDIDSKINTVISVISDCTNLISSVNGEVEDIDNDIRTLAESTNNVQNDIRVLADYQIPGDVGFQSLGTEYIKVYINEEEKIDVTIDTITITKVLNGVHTASFELGRTYDSTKPDTDSTVLIKYHNWLLYKGYISSITPASTPESIRINCSDKYWKRNREKVYFFVGHKPEDNEETYYYYISHALSNAIGWNPGIGNFIPQTMNLFGTPESDAIASLITNSGNFAWYYDENENKKLWEAGRGSIINLERQELDKNLGLYQVLKHQFTESILNIVNKLRVQMGDKVIRTFNITGGTKEYPAYTYVSVAHTAVNPDWDDNYEILAKNSGTGYGWDWHNVSDKDKYSDVFTKYKLPFLDPEMESWTDRYPPQVEIIIPWFGSSWECSVKEGLLTEGFTIDYENRELIFNEPIYLVRKNEYGMATEIKRAMVSLSLWKKKYYSNTNEGDDPESDISYPLMFFTDKVGTYPETIINLLQLSNLSIQYGGRYEDDEGERTIIPSWNDTAFAKDLAYWQLSKTAYKEIKGSINVTLDTVVTYGMNLSNRIQIDGVTENALNIMSMTYNISNFTVAIQLQNGQYYRRNTSLPSHGV